MKLLHYSFVKISICLLICVKSTETFCPSACQCSDGVLKNLGANFKTISTNCTRANLSNFPILLNPRTKTLILTQNRLSSLTLDELSIYPDLEYLDLSHNRLLAVEQGAFFRLQKLKVLRLNNNLLTSLSIETFAGLAELKFLDLSQNLIGRLATSIFSDLPRLESLNLTKNSIGSISTGAFVNLVSLKEIFLAYNDLNYVPKEAFRSVESLRILDLGKNKLKTLESGSFSLLSQLEILNLASNQIEKIEDDSFVNLINLRHLNLFDNKLAKIPTINFRYLTELQRLEIGENLFSEVPTSAFEGLGRLKFLSVIRCPFLKSTALNSFSGLYELETLFLAENPQLSNIHPSSFEQRNLLRSENGGKFYEIVLLNGEGSLTDTANDGFRSVPSKDNNLKRVFLHKNHLHTLSTQTLPYDQLYELDLRQNPWNCDCNARLFPEILRKMYNNLEPPRADFEGNETTGSVTLPPATCHGPEQLIGRAMTSLDGKDFEYCDTDTDMDWARTLALVLTALTLLTIVAGLALRFRWEVVRFCSVLKIFNSKDKAQYDRGSLASSGGSQRTNQSGATTVYRDNNKQHPQYILAEPYIQLHLGPTDETPKLSPKIGSRLSRHPVVACDYYFHGYEKPYKTEYRQVLPHPTSDYYSGTSSNGGYLPATTPLSAQAFVSRATLDRTGSFRIIQTLPVPITEV